MSPKDIQMSKGFCSDCPYAEIPEDTEEDAIVCNIEGNEGWIVDDPKHWCSHHPLRRVHIYAEKAMQGIVSGNQETDHMCYLEKNAIVGLAYDIAEAMIAEAAKRIGGVKSPSRVVDECPNCGADGTASVLRDSFGVRIICSGLTACGYSPGPYETDQEAWAAWRGEGK